MTSATDFPGGAAGRPLLQNREYGLPFCYNQNCVALSKNRHSVRPEGEHAVENIRSGFEFSTAKMKNITSVMAKRQS